MRQLSSQDLLKIFGDCLIKAAKTTGRTKVESVKQIAGFIKKQYNRYTAGGVDTLTSDWKSIQQSIRNLPSATQQAINHFKALSKQDKVQILVQLILGFTIFSLAAGGIDADGGIPDLDLAIWGIGGHRSFFTHSIIAGLSIEFVGRFLLEIVKLIRDRLPENHHPAWVKIFSVIDSYSETAISAVWLGIGTHLIVDSSLLVGGFKTYSHLPVAMSAFSQKIVFAANGAASIIFATKPGSNPNQRKEIQ